MRRVLFVLVMFLSASTVLSKSLDRINWADRAAWSCVKAVAVRPFTIAGEFRGPKTQDEYMTYFVARLAGELVRPGGIERVVLIKKDEPSSGFDAVLTGDFLELSTGSRAARFWIGFGAGTAKCEVRIRGYRPDDRTAVFDLEHARVSPFSLSGDANLGDIEAVVSDIGEELLHQRGTCNPADMPPLSPPPATAQTTVPVGAQVSIETSVENADVYVDGKFVGNAPLPSFRLSTGTHTIEVKSAGYADWKREITIQEGAATRVVAQLEKAPNQ